jgi:hypothetical protein
MFLQHSTPASQAPTALLNNSQDFELIIQVKNKEGLKGLLKFNYLNQPFEAKIKITPASIQILSQYPIVGIIASAPLLQQDDIVEHPYLLNATLTKSGYQNVLWLMLDLIHLFNLIRFKPGSLVELYRETVANAKKDNDKIEFGHIPLEGPIAQVLANILSKKMTRKHKYVYGNSLHLLESIQQIINNYPPQFFSSSKFIEKQDLIPFV